MNIQIKNLKSIYHLSARDKGRRQPLVGHGVHCRLYVYRAPLGDEGYVGKHGEAVEPYKQGQDNRGGDKRPAAAARPALPGRPAPAGRAAPRAAAAPGRALCHMGRAGVPVEFYLAHGCTPDSKRRAGPA